MSTFTVTGSKALKTAFIATLQELGYNPYGGGTIEIISGPKDYNIEVIPRNKIFIGHTRVEGTVYTLPAQWDEAVKAATVVPKKEKALPIGTEGKVVTVTEGEGIVAEGTKISRESLVTLYNMMRKPGIGSPWPVTFDTVTVGCTSGITASQLADIINTAKKFGIK